MRIFNFVWLKVCVLVLAVFSMLLCFIGAAAADEVLQDTEEEPEVVEVIDSYESESGDVTVNISLVVPQVEPGLDQEEVSAADTSSEDAAALSDFDISLSGGVTSDVVENAQSDGLPSLIVSLLGEYSPRTYSVNTYFSDGSMVTTTEYVPGLAGLDWPWLVGACLFALVLYSFFRLLGGVLRG